MIKIAIHADYPLRRMLWLICVANAAVANEHRHYTSSPRIKTRRGYEYEYSNFFRTAPFFSATRHLGKQGTCVFLGWKGY